jgi:divalent metal cation (Fe/Co/Zn/Cd) transporter
MSNVRSTPITQRQHQSRDWPMLFAKAGVWLAALSFGGIFWAINGGYSVIGLGVVASSFNEQGRAFWAAMSAITFPIPGPTEALGLSANQPLLPWLGVVSASLLQVVVVYLKLKGREIPRWLLIAATLISAYDLGTTYAGLGTVAWIAGAGFVPQAIIALFITFVVEATIGLMIRRL